MPLINNCYGYGKSGSVPQLCDQVNNFKVSAGELSAKLTWSAPIKDEDNSFVGARIVRKVGSAPKNKSDGTVVYEGTEFTYTDTGLTEGTTYYYRAFAYNDKKKYQTALCVASIKAEYVYATLNDNSWDTIRSISDEGQAANYWAVGDCKEIVLNGTVKNLTLSNYTVCVFILGFDHNSSVEGANRIHFQLGKTALTGGKDICLCDKNYGASNGPGYFFMNEAGSSWNSTNRGGWAESWMRTSILGTSLTDYSGTFIGLLPTELIAVLKSVTKYTDNTGAESTAASAITATTDYAFLLSEFEVYGGGISANSYESRQQAQYAYYSAGNSKIKYKHNGVTTSARHWLRSPCSNSDLSFCCVDSNGLETGIIAVCNYGIAPAFCV